MCDKSEISPENDNLYLAELYGNLAKTYQKLREFHLSKVSGIKTPQISSLRGEKLPNGEENSPKEFLTSPRFKAWGITFVEKAFCYRMSGSVRADRFKNFWVVDARQRLGWRSVSEEQFRQTFNTGVNFIEECQEAIRECQDLKTFNEKFCSNLKKGKWKRRSAILESAATYKGFVKFCRSEHKRLPKLRG